MTISQPGYPVTTSELVDHIGTYVDQAVMTQVFSQAGQAIVDTSGSWAFYADGTIVRIALTARAAPLGGPLTVQYMLNDVVFVTLVLEDGERHAEPLELSLPVRAGDRLSVASTTVGTNLPAESPVTQVFYR